MFAVELVFHGNLAGLLRREWRGRDSVVRRNLGEKTAVKDVIEACGVPHTEVDLILATEDGSSSEQPPLAVELSWPVQAASTLQVYGAPASADLFPAIPRLQARGATRFVADGHLGKLARNLRLLGLDTVYERDADDPRLRQIMATEGRVLLTRDRPLLMHAVVREGYCPRSDDHEEQTREVLRRFDLTPMGGLGTLAPFSRCLRCNTLLVEVPKTEVLAPLADEPLTLRHYEDFRRCPGCQSLYWPGTHARKLSDLLARLLS